jgi:uncharacterized membrane protein YqjE
MTGETTPSRNPAGRAGFLNNFLAFINALIEFIESRSALLARESKATFGRWLGVLACLIGALMFLVISYVFIIVSVIAGIARLVQVSWIWVALAAALLHFAFVFIFLLIARGLASKAPFRELAAELKKDREWIRNLDETSRPTS